MLRNIIYQTSHHTTWQIYLSNNLRNCLGEMSITCNLCCETTDWFSQGTCQINWKNGITNQKSLTPILLLSWVQISATHFRNNFVPRLLFTRCQVNHSLHFLWITLTWDWNGCPQELGWDQWQFCHCQHSYPCDLGFWIWPSELLNHLNQHEICGHNPAYQIWEELVWKHNTRQFHHILNECIFFFQELCFNLSTQFYISVNLTFKKLKVLHKQDHNTISQA